MTNVTHCPICTGQEFESHLTCVDYTVSHETFSLRRCTACDFVITSPRPVTTDLGRYYKSDAYISHQKEARSLQDHIYLTARQFTLKWKQRLISRFHQGTQKNLLDYGCGTGEFVRFTRSQQWQAVGFEPSSEARNQTAKEAQPFIFSTIPEILTSGPYSVITLWHVLEHIENLNETLDLLKTCCAPNGTIFIAVPNHKSADAHHYGKYWAAYDVPRHLWHFNMSSMKHLLKNHSLTLKDIIPMKLDAYYVSLLSEKYMRPQTSTLAAMGKSTIIATKSNLKAQTSKQYSSLIYVVGT